MKGGRNFPCSRPSTLDEQAAYLLLVPDPPPAAPIPEGSIPTFLARRSFGLNLLRFLSSRVIHMRIVKIGEPVARTVENYLGRIVRLEEGQLLTVAMRGGPPEPWSYDIDRNTKDGAGFHALWDASQKT
ncbi:hypothetical protein B0H13DRAFT_2340990 [Mycena leptocephala]|nr:hypothetical protein B0H13DRAFT_2340990 [Mycena leptocephala]